MFCSKEKKCFRGEQNDAEVALFECCFCFSLKSNVWEICKTGRFGKKPSNSHLVRWRDSVNITHDSQTTSF